MTDQVLSPVAARRVFLTLTFTRWFPVGLIAGLITLLALERGLTVAQALSAFAVMGFIVFALELPTSGFADAFGRRPVFVAAAVVNVLVGCAYLFADSFWAFASAAALMGVFRALDSGPLEAWYVDTVHVTEPGADVDRALAARAPCSAARWRWARCCPADSCTGTRFRWTRRCCCRSLSTSR